MRSMGNPVKDALYFGYRLVSPIIDPVRMYSGMAGYVWFIRDFLRYRKHVPLQLSSLFPVLDEKVRYTPFDSHYYYQEIWALERIFKRKPKRHVDVASKYQFSGFVSLFTKSEFVDIRPVTATLPNLKIIDGSILSLPYKNRSQESVSCLHVVEHIGLGRYGDPLDPDGTKKACLELVRILAPKGRLYLSTPVGREMTYFNAHRVHLPETIIRYMRPLRLESFSVVDDKGVFIKDADPDRYGNLRYGCGMFEFVG